MKVIFMGTPDFAVPTLQTLIDEEYEIVAVVTQPDKPKGRGKKESMPPVKELALKYGLPVLQPERIKGDEAFYNHIQSLNPDLIIVVAFGQILPQSVLDLPKYGCINIHGSLLPAYRGAAPIQWAIVNGEKTTGVTIMYMDKGMDTGDMLLKKEMPITEEDTYASLHDKMKVVGAKTLKEALPLILEGGKTREKQDSDEATYAPMIQKSLGLIEWSKSAKELDCLIRGLNPWPACYTYYHGDVMKVWKAAVLEENSTKSSGSILEVSKQGIKVQTGEGSLLIEEIQMPNKKRMAVSEYIKGNEVDTSVVLGL